MDTVLYVGFYQICLIFPVKGEADFPLCLMLTGQNCEKSCMTLKLTSLYNASVICLFWGWIWEVYDRRNNLIYMVSLYDNWFIINYIVLRYTLNLDFGQEVLREKIRNLMNPHVLPLNNYDHFTLAKKPSWIVNATSFTQLLRCFIN